MYSFISYLSISLENLYALVPYFKLGSNSSMMVEYHVVVWRERQREHALVGGLFSVDRIITSYITSEYSLLVVL